jgi:hypothetical protein
MYIKGRLEEVPINIGREGVNTGKEFYCHLNSVITSKLCFIIVYLGL